MKKTSYETSKKLAEAGFKAETDFYWVKWNEGEPELVHEKEQTPALIEKVGAWDLETILEALPKRIDINGVGCRFEMYSFADLDRNELISIGYMRTRNFTVLSSKNESLADCAAKMWLKLKKENLI